MCRQAVVEAAIVLLPCVALPGPANAQSINRDVQANVSVECTALLEGVNRGMAERKPDAFVAAASFYESGRCVGRSDPRAVELLGQAARMGSGAGVRRLSRRFALGNGVPQSYANAGAWLTGKGATNEALQPWDYSIGYAYAVLSQVLSRVQFPAGELREASEASFVVEIDAQHPRQVNLRPTAANAASHPKVYGALRAALNEPLAAVLASLTPPDPALLTAARVAVPVSVRSKGDAALDVLEDTPILR